jgi:hypothetical protein
MDYFISCDLSETDESDGHYNETLVRLKRLPTYYYRPPVPATRQPCAHFALAERQIFLNERWKKHVSRSYP